MKELSIEQKAKAYDELKVTAQELEHDGCFDKITLFDLFPELKESEDERIRKELIKETKGSEVRLFETVTNDEFIAWLERQGEQKPVDKVESNKKFTPIESALKDLICDVDNSYTIEQVRRFLFEYGYKDKILNAAQEEMQKQEWSEEDEVILKEALRMIESPGSIFKGEILTKKVDDWLKSIKGRVQIQPKQEWSDKDKKIVHHLENAIKYDKPRTYLNSQGIEITDVCDWLKSLKPQNRWKPSDELDEASYQVGVKRVLENPESYGLTKYNWKPSDEQMKALDRAQAELCSTEYNKPICDLIDALNKLKE